MKRLIKMNKVLAVSILVMTFLVIKPALAGDVGLMTTDELKQQLGSSDIIVLDVRAGRDWSSSEFKIKGAVRENPSDFENWSSSYPKDKKLVLYCA